MSILQAGLQVKLKNVLYLTDFSDSSEKALPFVTFIAREYGATVHAFHVLTPEPSVYMTPDLVLTLDESREQTARARMGRLESQLGGLPHEAKVERGTSVWAVLAKALKSREIDLIVLGTHGRTGARKLLLGSVAEEIFRQSPVPVLTVGPMVANDVHIGFQRLLLATDFKPESRAAAAYAFSMVQENREAQLYLLHVIRSPERHREKTAVECSVANAMHQLYELVPGEAEFCSRPKLIVEHGDPGERILAIARQKETNLIVLGLRQGQRHLEAATHLERTTAHTVVAHALCPVLTVRS